ncbi:NifB/NifX family molybdenum-iron cluster-binding protein [Shewanella atlantica]|uniref:NifB/NifX family molybdenum-iron cluster-binding protein n=1 Tax=Shewanella atlantica TaxID=271099 RepID=UPI0037368D11
MIIAMPMSRDRLASHFTKAQHIGFFNEQHQLIGSFANPALEGEGCSAKKAMLELIINNKTNIVIVQHIGERMLGKLLDAGISVSKGDSTIDTQELLKSTRNLNLRLLDASQGRASLNHEKKGGCCGGDGKSGGCGCGSHGADSQDKAQASAGKKAGGCCGGHAGHGQSGNKRSGGCGCGGRAKGGSESVMSHLAKQAKREATQQSKMSYAGFRKL